MSKGKELAKNTAIMLFGKLFTQFLVFLLLPLYTHLLPKDEYGAVDLISTYITIAIPVTTVQLEMAAFRYLIDARKEREKQGEIIRTTLKDFIVRTVLFMLLYLIAVQFFDFNYKYFALLAAIAVGFSNILLQISRGLGKNTDYTIASVLAGMTTIGSNLIMICMLHFGAESILISMALANMVCSAYLLFRLGIPKLLGGSKSSKQLSRSMIKYSLPLVPNSISWWLISSSDRTIVSIVLGVAANGTYAVACKFPSILTGFVGVFSNAWTESASLHINDKDRDEYFSNVASNALRIFSGLGVGVVAFLPFVFNIIIGEEYRDAYEYIPVAILGVFLNSMVLVYSSVYVAKKMTKKVAATSIASAIINIVVDLGLIKFIGLYAAVVSTAVAFLVMVIYRHFDVKKYVKIKYNPKDIILAVIAFILVSICYYANSLLYICSGAALAVLYATWQNRGLVEKVLKGVFRR